MTTPRCSSAPLTTWPVARRGSAIPRYGKNARLWGGQGDTVIDFSKSIAGGMTLTFSANVREEPIGDFYRQYPINTTRALTFDRYLLETDGNGERLVDWMADWGVDSVGELVLEPGTGRIYWFRDPIRSSVTVTMPYEELTNLSGPLSAKNPWGGVAAEEEELDSGNLIGEANTQITWKPVGGAGGLGLLTSTRTGDATLQLETKRGSAAWTRNTKADAALAADVSTPLSAVSLDLVVPDLQEDDLVRVRLPSATLAGNAWSGRLIAAYPADLD